MTWHLDQLVRVLHGSPQGARILRLTPTLVITSDGRRWSRKTGVLYGVGPTATRIEVWS